jgi:hypothetical protein
MIIPRNYTFDDFNSFQSIPCAHYTGASSHFEKTPMAVALSRVTPAVVQRLQVPVQVLLYAGLFVFAEYLVGWLLPLPTWWDGADADAHLRVIP